MKENESRKINKSPLVKPRAAGDSARGRKSVNWFKEFWKSVQDWHKENKYSVALTLYAAPFSDQQVLNLLEAVL